MSFDKYDLKAEIHTTQAIVVSRGTRRSDGAAVICKQLPPTAMNRNAIERLRHEHRILERLAKAGVTKVPRVLEYTDTPRPTLVLQDMGGMSLWKCLKDAKFSPQETMKIALALLGALNEVHRARVVHKDIDPNNIVLDRKTGALQLIDFGISTFISHEVQTTTAVSAIEGTLAYISPEQTGRLGRPLDFRSDYYSMGVTLYELLCGERPFLQRDPNDLVYAVLTERPKALTERVPGFPPFVAELVDKLMAKNPEDRYQSARGLRADMEQALAILEGRAAATHVGVGAHDRSDEFEIKQKLYGRAVEVDRVLQAYRDATTQGCRTLMTVQGPSGIGKSALVGVLQAELTGQRGNFVGGKYDQLRRHIPFNALNQAISGWVRRVMLEDEATRDMWRRRCMDAMGHIGQALINIIPSVQQLVGPQRPMPEVAPVEAEQRLLALMTRFIHMLARDQPLVLFLDDVQWVDAGTLKLLKMMMGDDRPTGGLLVICAYRDNEVPAGHPFHTLMGEFRRLNTPVLELSVGPLAKKDIEELIADATRAAAEPVRGLAELVFSKTAGNPFFVREFMTYLWSEQLLKFDDASGAWTWDDKAVRMANVTDNVVDLMAQKIKAMPVAEQRIISLCACLGADFGLNALAHANGTARAATATLLETSLEAGFIQPMQRTYRFGGNERDEAADDVRYKFAHDRIQQAAYNLLSKEEAAKLHHDIATRLIQAYGAERAEDWVFSVVSHLNSGRAHVTSHEARDQAARLNYIAGCESQKAMAYAISVDYHNAALQFLGETCWENAYELTRGIYLSMAESEVLLGAVEQAREHLDLLLKKSRTPAEIAEVQKQRGVAMMGLGRWEEAVDAGMSSLSALGFTLSKSKKPSLAPVLVQFVRTLMILGKKEIPKLIDAPEMKSERELKILEILSAIYFAVFTHDPNLNALLSIALARLTLVHGQSRVSPYAYAGLTVPLSQQNNYKLAIPLARLALAMLDKRPDATMPAFTYIVANGFVLHTIDQPQVIVERYRKGYQAGVDSGDPYWTTMVTYLELLTALRFSVDVALETGDRYHKLFVNSDNKFQTSLHTSVRQGARCFAGKTQSPLSFDDEEYSEARDAATFAAPSAEAVFHIYKAWTAFVHGDLELAHKHTMHCMNLASYSGNAEIDVNYIYFIGAVVMTQYAIAHGQTQVANPKRLKEALAKFDAAAAHADVYKGFALLVRAQVAAMKHQVDVASGLFEEACGSLGEQGNLFATAIGYELATRHFLKHGKRISAHGYAAQAVNSYSNWGATVKTKMLRTEWASMLRQSAAVSMRDADHPMTTQTYTATSGTTQTVDVPALLRLFQALSSEKTPDTLIERITATLKENAGADRAVLFLHQGALTLVGDTSHPGMRGSLDDLGNDRVPKRVISYIWSSGESVTSMDKVASEYAVDPYMASVAPKSMLCAPLVHQGKRIGVMYLESRTLSNAFTEDRMVLLQAIASQAAIALENSYLYAHMEETIKERTSALEEAQKRVLKLEKESTEVRLAGGFAHEVRNALSGAQYAVLDSFPDEGESVLDSTMVALKQMVGLAKGSLDENAMGQFTEQLQVVGGNMNAINSVVELVQQAMARSLKITGDILNYAQVGQLVRHSEKTDVRKVLDKLMGEFSHDLQEKHIDAQMDLPSEMNVMMSEGHVYAILRNLVANARDAVAAKQEEGHRMISLMGKVENKHLLVTVQDTGVGMPEHVKGRLFEPFFSTKGANGTGLGLAMSKKLSELYGGEMSFVSNESSGTTFLFRVPLNTDKT